MVKGRVIRVRVPREDHAANIAAMKAAMAPKRKARVSKARLTKAVKAVVQSQLETKNVSKIVENLVTHNSTILTSDWVYPLPPINQGTAENERIGDRVRPKALIVKCHVSFGATTGGFPTIKCSLFTLKHKKYTSQSTLAANISTDGVLMLMDGDGNTAGYDGTLRASQYKVNTDLWTQISRKDFTLSKDAAAPTQGSCFREFTIRIPCPKTLVYTLDTDLLPQNFCPAMALGYTYVSGASPDTVNTPVVVFSQAFFTYTDA